MQKVNYLSEAKYIEQAENLKLDERADFEYQQRRHDQWKENYELNRDTVIINRLTQRQSVNIPLMKGTIKTILSLIDEFPAVEFDELGNNKQKELFFNSYWEDIVIKDKMEVKDIVDKKQELLYGKTWTKLNVGNGKFESEILEPYDILVDRYGDPSDLETLHHLIHCNIFRTLDQLSMNENYDQSAVNRLKVFFASQQGLIKTEEVTKLMQAKNQRLQDMGVPDMMIPFIGHTVVELRSYFVKVWDEKDQEDHWHVIVKAEHEILSAKPLQDILNIDFLPFVTWSSDPERNDHYPDGTADIVRTPNKILNVYFSQLIENRTLRGFNMNFYDATAKEGWSPQTFEPQPFGWYPLPGKPDEVFKSVQIPELEGSLEEMNYIQELVESATAATATTKGETESPQITLGEVQLTVQAAKERISSISKFYTLAQREKADKFAKIVNANADKLDEVKLYRKSHRGNWFKRNIKPDDWRSEEGYTCRVVSTTERQQKDIESIQKLKAIQPDFQGNAPFAKIMQQKELEFGGLNPDEVKQVMDFAKQQPAQPPGAVPGQPAPKPQVTPQPNVSVAQPA